MEKRLGLIFLGLLFLIFSVQAQNEENFFIIGGVVKNSKNKKNIEYVNISVVGTNITTIANADGEFVLKINNESNANEIELSCMG
jgi:hypothetical protein